VALRFPALEAARVSLRTSLLALGARLCEMADEDAAAVTEMEKDSTTTTTTEQTSKHPAVSLPSLLPNSDIHVSDWSVGLPSAAAATAASMLALRRHTLMALQRCVADALVDGFSWFFETAPQRVAFLHGLLVNGGGKSAAADQKQQQQQSSSSSSFSTQLLSRLLPNLSDRHLFGILIGNHFGAAASASSSPSQQQHAAQVCSVRMPVHHGRHPIENMSSHRAFSTTCN
jgi:hypothetical protein